MSYKKVDKNRFNYKMNWGKRTLKIIDNRTGQLVSLKEWDMIELSNLLSQLIVKIVRKKGKIKDMDGKIYTKEDLIKTIAQDAKKQKEQKKNKKFEAYPGSNQ